MSEVSVAPPFSRDVLARTWQAVKAFSDAGDAAWTVALAWVALQVASPRSPGWWSPRGRSPGRWCCSSVGWRRTGSTPAAS
ncbi:hypothetical protein [Cellulomonas soli]